MTVDLLHPEEPPETGDDEPCEGCGKPSVTADSDGIPLCRECADACDEQRPMTIRGAALEIDRWLEEHSDD